MGEITSGPINIGLYWHEIEEIAAFFKQFGAEELTVCYGYDCNLDPKEWYQEIEIKTDELLGFLSRSIAEGIYHLAEDNFHIQSKSLALEFMLCHENDIHLTTDNEEVRAYMKAKWAAKVPPGYERLNEVWVSLLDAQVLDSKPAPSAT